MSEPVPVATRAPVETKVYAATAGFVGSSVVATLLIWLMGAWLWDAGFGSDQVDAALAAVPSPVSAAVLLVLGSLGTFLAGYAAPHTPRPSDGQDF